MTTLTATDDLVEQLYHVEGKAEIIGGKIVYLPMPGDFPTYTAEQIGYSLRTYERQRKNGRSFGDGNHFVVDLPDRRTFSPDAGYHLGPRAGMRFFDGAPTFAVEVRKGDYGPAAERAMQAKRADYFAAGTLVVWDVDVLGDGAAVGGLPRRRQRASRRRVRTRANRRRGTRRARLANGRGRIAGHGGVRRG